MRLALWVGAVILTSTNLVAQRSEASPKLEFSDPIAAIDGAPVFWGEVSYLLATKLRIKDPAQADLNVQRASSALLVRQHLAMRSLRQQGGDRLETLLDRQWQSFLTGLQQRGQSIEQYCERSISDERSVHHAIDWETAWRGYLKSRMTDQNLKRYYQANAALYQPTKWDVSHLFLGIDAQNRTDSLEIAKQRITLIKEKLESAKASAGLLESTFADLARDESEGATANDGGHVGWVSDRGDLPANLIDAIRKTDVGSVTPVVRSPMGFHLALVHDRSTTEVQYEQLADPAQLRRDAADALFDTLVDAQRGVTVTWYLKQLQPPTESTSGLQSGD
ncbi:peptidylprolyl isomerase [Stieleria sp. TO1_6]|uniref:peptidylprolyl isomerase n=1 Tax=Stieleria tagensis TaxID=2956795 RepID=UPI00209B36BD|nr:peptidylprolyl isomerase [Stieleria tagensis]MCO8120589.1 peptidylprolyl isomerase [Stieleria tagensis]